MRHVLGRVEAILCKAVTECGVAARGRKAWLGLGLVCGLLGSPTFGEVAGDPVSVVAAAKPETHEVFYPGRGCGSRVLEVEVWDDARETWSRHPEHPRVVADSCQLEARSRPLHQIRVRCIDPSARTNPPPGGWAWRARVNLEGTAAATEPRTRMARASRSRVRPLEAGWRIVWARRA